MKMFCAPLLFLFSYGWLYAQDVEQLNYKVLRNQEEVGALAVSKSFTSGGVLYSLTSSVKINALITFHIRESIADEYENNQLIHSRHIREINDYTSVDRVLVKSGNQYYCEAEALPHLGNSIMHSILSLYFQEPLHYRQIYSESFQQLVSIDKIKPGVYRLTLPNQKITDYYYENGWLWKVEGHTKWGIVTFLRDLPLTAIKP